MHRRTLLSAAIAAGGSAALGGSLWRAVATTPGGSTVRPLRVGASPATDAASGGAARGETYGRLRRPDENGLRLPAGFTSRVVARSGRRVPGTAYPWHDAPDGGACFAVSAAIEHGTSADRARSGGAAGAGWVYVSNSELQNRRGGASAIRFGPDAAVLDAYRILGGTSRNCAGGATPWGTWLSCEEVERGYVFETHPLGGRLAARRPALGRFKHEAAAVDPGRRCVYLTEDEGDGCLYRFVPARWPSLDAGRLDVLCGGDEVPGRITWQAVPDPAARAEATRRQVAAARHFDGGEGAVFGAGTLWFTTKGDGRVWRLDATRDIVDLEYDESSTRSSSPLTGVDNVTRAASGDLYVAEDRGSMEICLISPEGQVSSFLRLTDHQDSELTGPAFSPDGSRLYFSSQRGSSGRDDGGVTYEVRGPFRA